MFEPLKFYCIFDIEANLLRKAISKEVYQSQNKHLMAEYVSENLYILLQLLQYKTTLAPPNDTAIVTIEITFASRYISAIVTIGNYICTSMFPPFVQQKIIFAPPYIPLIVTMETTSQQQHLHFKYSYDVTMENTFATSCFCHC